MRKFLPILETLLIGDRIVVPKSGIRVIQHHAIYLGQNRGQHLFIENKEGIGVRVVSAAIFFSDVLEVTRIMRFSPRPGYSRQDLYSYALTKVGRAYHLLKYNCEHLCNELQHRVVKSKQADTGVGMALLGIALLLLGAAGSSSKNR